MPVLIRLVALLFLGILTGPSQGQQLKTIDHIYDSKVETVLLFPQVSANQLDPSLTLNPPVISLDEQVALQLEFDDLTATYRSFRARLVHCNADWHNLYFQFLGHMYNPRLYFINRA